MQPLQIRLKKMIRRNQIQLNSIRTTRLEKALLYKESVTSNISPSNHAIHQFIIMSHQITGKSRLTSRGKPCRKLLHVVRNDGNKKKKTICWLKNKSRINWGLLRVYLKSERTWKKPLKRAMEQEVSVQSEISSRQSLRVSTQIRRTIHTVDLQVIKTLDLGVPRCNQMELLAAEHLTARCTRIRLSMPILARIFWRRL